MKWCSFDENEKINIICGFDLVITSLSMGLIPVTQYFPCFVMGTSWGWGAFIAFISAYLICLTNKEKYKTVKADKLLSLGRNILDTVFNIIGIVFTWVCLYVPVPFSLEAFLNPEENIVIFPIGALLNGGILLLPSLITNKKILKKYTDK